MQPKYCKFWRKGAPGKGHFQRPIYIIIIIRRYPDSRLVPSISDYTLSLPETQHHLQVEGPRAHRAGGHAGAQGGEDYGRGGVTVGYCFTKKGIGHPVL